MRIILVGFLALHGLAHLVGFLSPWGLIPAPAPGTAPPPSPNALFGGRVLLGDTAARGLGIAWLLVGVTFVVVAVGLWQQTSWSRPALAVTTLVSLALTIVWWPNARIGTAIDIALLVSMFLTIYASYRGDISALREESREGSVMVSTIAGPIEYATLGDGAPVLVLHGTGGGWDHGIRASRDRVPFGFRLIAPSRFGYLRTPLPSDPSPAMEADAWAALLDQLQIERVAVMSFSAGAAPAVQFALRHPQRVSKLVLVVPAAGGIIAEKAAGPPAFVMNTVLKYDFPMWAAMHVSRKTMLNVVAVPASLVPELADQDAVRLDETIRSLLPVSARKNGIMNDAKTQSGNALYPIARIAAPTLLISAADDLYETLRVAKRAAAVIPRAAVMEFKSGGHLLLGHADEMWPAVAKFLQSDARDSMISGRNGEKKRRALADLALRPNPTAVR